MLERAILLVLITTICLVPGAFAITFIRISKRSKILLLPFFSLAYFICLIGITTQLDIPFNWFCLVSLIAFSVGCLFRFNQLPSIKISQLKKEDFFLLLFSVYLLIPFFIRNLPAGKDSTMQGYVSWLIIDRNNLPESYEPLFPIDSFGSFSSGLSTLSSVFSAFEQDYLHLGLLFISLLSYVLCLFAFVLFFKQFFSYRTALITSVIILFCSRIPQDSFNWGGNSTVLSFAFVVAFSAIILMVLKNRDKVLIVLSGFILAAIPLTHLIPAAGLLYLGSIGACILLVQHSKALKSLFLPAALMAILTAMLIMPMILSIEPLSEEVTDRIKLWQGSMGPKFSNESFISELRAVLAMMKYRIGDTIFITFLIGLALTFNLKSNRMKVGVPALFILVVVLLIWNSNHWFLPASEILYPERIVFFILLPVGFLIGNAIDNLKNQKGLKFTGLSHLKFAFYVLALASPIVSFKYFGKKAYKKEVGKEYFEAFDWINQNLPPNAVLKTSYHGHGVWLPMMVGRTTDGAHLHFIHTHIQDDLNRIQDKYYFIENSLEPAKNEVIMSEISDKKVIYQNSAIQIYH